MENRLSAKQVRAWSIGVKLDASIPDEATTAAVEAVIDPYSRKDAGLIEVTVFFNEPFTWVDADGDTCDAHIGQLTVTVPGSDLDAAQAFAPVVH
jgi:hypothetical protein